MALKAVIVDDEFRVIDTLKHLIDWKTHGFEIVGAAGDGAAALAMVEKLRPHVVVTDIRMPGISGLELIGRIRASCPETEIICISGYTDFAYAREAIGLQVADYLLKPLDEEALIAALSGIRERFARRMQLERQLSRLNRYEQHRMWAKRMRGERAGDDDIDWPRRYGTVLLIELDEDVLLSQDEQEIELKTFILENILQDYEGLLGQGSLHWFEKSPGEYGLVWHHAEPFDGAPDWVAEMKRIVERYCGCSVTIGIGDSVVSPGELHRSHESAYFALEHRFFFGKGTILPSNGLHDELPEPGLPLDVSGLASAMEAGDRGQAALQTEILFRRLKERGRSERYVKTLLTDIMVRLVQPLQRNNGSVQQLMDSGADLDAFWQTRSLDELQTWFADFVERLLQYNEAVQRKRPHKIIRQLELYLQEHYAEDLTLKSLGAMFYIHPNYLGQLIRKEKGISFPQWLHAIRIGQAKKRLVETDDLIIHIAQSVGYSDINNFYTQFKRLEGKAPGEFRGGRQ